MFHWPNVGISSGIHVGSVSTAGGELHPVPGPALFSIFITGMLASTSSLKIQHVLRFGLFSTTKTLFAITFIKPLTSFNTAFLVMDI